MARISTPRSTTTSATIFCGLMFTACHPVLSTEARVALTLRLIGGLTTDEIARAFLDPRADHRAAHRARQAHAGRQRACPSKCRAATELAERARLGARSHLSHLQRRLFGDRRRRLDAARSSAQEALRLGRILAELAPRGAGGARPRRADGDPGLALRRAHRAERRADPAARPEPRALGSASDPPRACRAGARRAAAERARSAPGPYTLQAAIAACHARAHTPEETDWPRIVGIYEALAEIVPSPVVELNRAVAVSMAFGPAAGLELVDQLTSEPTLKAYHLLPSVRGDLLKKLGRVDEARAEFERAASLAGNARERNLLLERAAATRS